MLSRAAAAVSRSGRTSSLPARLATCARATAIAFAGVGRPVAAHGSPGQPGRTITVEGVGTVRGVPDTAQLSFGVDEERATARAALAAAGDKMRSILAALRQAGIAKVDL